MRESAISLSAAKSMLENEEGLNYVRVGWTPLGPGGSAKLCIALPPGVRRKPNLSGFEEDEAGRILVYEPNVADEIVLEIYSDDPVPCGPATIVAEMAYEKPGQPAIAIVGTIEIEIAPEGDMDDLVVNPEVADLAAFLSRTTASRLIVDACLDPRTGRRSHAPLERGSDANRNAVGQTALF